MTLQVKHAVSITFVHFLSGQLPRALGGIIHGLVDSHLNRLLDWPVNSRVQLLARIDSGHGEGIWCRCSGDPDEKENIVSVSQFH
jgi:hypothetical protein